MRIFPAPLSEALEAPKAGTPLGGTPLTLPARHLLVGTPGGPSAPCSVDSSVAVAEAFSFVATSPQGTLILDQDREGELLGFLLTFQGKVTPGSKVLRYLSLPEGFFTLVSQAYAGAYRDRGSLEQSLESSSPEHRIPGGLGFSLGVPGGIYEAVFTLSPEGEVSQLEVIFS